MNTEKGISAYVFEGNNNSVNFDEVSVGAIYFCRRRLIFLVDFSLQGNLSGGHSSEVVIE